MVMNHPFQKILLTTDLYFGGKYRNSSSLAGGYAGRRRFYSGDFALRDGKAIVANLILDAGGTLFYFISIDYVAIL